MADQKSNLDSLFLTALEIASREERAVFLDNSCGEDRELRAEVERLLKSHEQAGLAAAFREGEAVVVGSARHSVLKTLGQTTVRSPSGTRCRATHAPVP